jgi:hypothetical protein
VRCCDTVMVEAAAVVLVARILVGERGVQRRDCVGQAQQLTERVRPGCMLERGLVGMGCGLGEPFRLCFIGSYC